MKILIVGVASFAGSQLAEGLIQRGHKIIGIDNYLTGCRENLLRLFKSPNFHFLQLDASKKELMLYFLKNIGKRDNGKWGPEIYVNMASNGLKGFSSTAELCRIIRETEEENLSRAGIQFADLEAHEDNLLDGKISFQDECKPKTIYMTVKIEG